MGRHRSLTGRIFVICAGILLAASSTGQHMEPGTEPASAFEGIEDIDEDTDMNANQQNDLAAALPTVGRFRHKRLQVMIAESGKPTPVARSDDGVPSFGSSSDAAPLQDASDIFSQWTESGVSKQKPRIVSPGEQAERLVIQGSMPATISFAVLGGIADAPSWSELL